MAPRKSADKELSKDQILGVARALFSTKGYREVSMRDIARELGCSHGAIYYHFDNKVELFNELVKKGFELLDSSMEQIVTGEHQLEDICMGFVSFGFNYPNHYEIMFMTKEDAFLEHSAPIKSYQRFVGEVSHFGVSPSDAYYLFASLHGFVSYHLRSMPFVNRGMTLARQYVQFLINRLA